MVEYQSMIDKYSTLYGSAKKFCKAAGISEQFFYAVRSGKKKITPKIVIFLARMHGEKPSDWLPEIYPPDLFG